MNYPEFFQLASIPVFSAVVGWTTSYIPVKMIFRPRHPWSFLKIQGLLPKRQKELARKIGETVEGKLLTMEDVLSKLDEQSLKEKIAPVIRDTIDSFIQKKLQQIPMIGMLLKGEMLAEIKEMLVNETLLTIPTLVATFGESLQENVSLKQMVQERVEQFDLSVLEEIVYAISGKELRAVVNIGGVLGFLMGLVQVGIVLL